MTYDKIILLIVILMLAGLAAYVEYRNRKKMQKNNYVITKVKCIDVTSNMDLKNGTTYDITYQYPDGKQVILTTSSRSSTEKLLYMLGIKKSKIYRNIYDKTDIKPYRCYIPLILGCLFIAGAEIYIELFM